MQRIRTRTIFILLVMVNLTTIFIAAQSLAETPVIGFIAQDTTWTQANSPYVTLGNIIVKEGVTLTIEPGATVRFDSGHSLTIEGALIARGTDKQGIKFTPKAEQKQGAWGGILFRDSSTDAKFDDAGNYVSGSILQYCTVEFAKTAVKAAKSVPFIDHCVISNSAWEGIFTYSSNTQTSDTITISNNTLTGNTTEFSGGGGIHVAHATATISNNVLTGNTACGGWGGGIYVKDSNVTISNNILTGNTAEFWGGGGIYVEDSTATISNNILAGNTAKFWGGGGIHVKGSTVTISNNILTGNTAESRGNGGGINVVYGTGTISNNTLTGNRAGNGGGISCSGSVTITDNTITENRISYPLGAAIAYSGGQEITGNLIANNVAEGGGNTFAVDIAAVGTPTLTGNAIIGNQTKFNLYYGYLQDKGVPNLNATNNYWGVSTETEIRVKIHDFSADDSKAAVDVVPFLIENPFPLGSLTIVVKPAFRSPLDILTIILDPKELPADVTITATLKDSKGKSVADESLVMVVSKGKGKLSKVNNKGDGIYTATYTASREVSAEVVWVYAPKHQKIRARPAAKAMPSKTTTEVIWVVAPKQRLAESIEIKLTKP